MMPFFGPNNPEVQNATNSVSPDFWGHLIPFENVSTQKRVIMWRKILVFGGVFWTLHILHMHNICTICTMILQKTMKEESWVKEGHIELPLCNFETTLELVKDNFETTLIQLSNNFETTLIQLSNNLETNLIQQWKKQQVATLQEGGGYFRERQLSNNFETTLRQLW